jgi:hypothetical protein
VIVQGSRYEGVDITGIRTVDGKERKFLHDRRVFSMADVGANGFEYEIKGEETLDAIADRFYGDDKLWWLIADVNNILFAFDVQPGDTIIIPDPNIRVQTTK